QSNRQKPEITRQAHQSTVLRSLHLFLVALFGLAGTAWPTFDGDGFWRSRLIASCPLVDKPFSAAIGKALSRLP
ncbi:hypothetical protein, partial [Acetobacter indonesiensis]|uniref:hypothetical protein n=1 Tax=Acetobacter indonesiensis TaxID=104101 RepID=UPI001C4F2661